MINFKKKKDEVIGEFKITNQVISYSGQVWQLRNITRVGKYKVNNPKPHKILDFLKPIGGFFFGIVLIMNEAPIGFLVVLLALGYFAFQVYQNKKHKPEFALKIEASSGTAEIFTTHDEEFVDQLVNLISRVMRSEEQKEFQVSIDNRTIIDNSLVDNRKSYNDIKDSTIIDDSNVKDSTIN